MSENCRQSLHSFPTRRSSDLVAEGEGARPVHLRIGVGVHRRPVGVRRGDVHVAPCEREVERFGRAAHGEEEADRKSTRLNSSHPSISYAVFCLKKKTQIAHFF